MRQHPLSAPSQGRLCSPRLGHGNFSHFRPGVDSPGLPIVAQKSGSTDADTTQEFFFQYEFELSPTIVVETLPRSGGREVFVGEGTDSVVGRGLPGLGVVERFGKRMGMTVMSQRRNVWRSSNRWRVSAR